MTREKYNELVECNCIIDLEHNFNEEIIDFIDGGDILHVITKNNTLSTATINIFRLSDEEYLYLTAIQVLDNSSIMIFGHIIMYLNDRIKIIN